MLSSVPSHNVGTLNFARFTQLNTWSGHSALSGKVKREWQNTKYVLYFFGSSGNSKRNYLRYVKKGIDQGRRPELVGKLLICVPCIKERNIDESDLIEGDQTTAAGTVNIEALEANAVLMY